MKKIFAIVCLSLLVSACSTTTNVKLPQGSKLYLNDSATPATVQEDGEVKTRPFFWSAIAGVPYRVVKDDKVVSEGKLAARFRPASIFFPPMALIYWPAGFAEEEYDLTKATAKPDSTAKN